MLQLSMLLDGTVFFFFFNDTATTEIYTLSLHDALPIATRERGNGLGVPERVRRHLACRHRARGRGSSGQRLLLLQDQGRDWRGDRRAEASGAVRAAAAMERSWIAQGSALRLRPRRLRDQGFPGTVRLRGGDVLP